MIEILPLEYHRYLNDDTYAYHMIAMAYRKQKKPICFLYYELKAFIHNPIAHLKIIKKLFT
jgi:hypothetical protein